MDIDYNAVVYNGMTVKDFITAIEPKLDEIMRGDSCYPIPANKLALVRVIRDLQVVYRRIIPEVNQYFIKKYGY